MSKPIIYAAGCLLVVGIFSACQSVSRPVQAAPRDASILEFGAVADGKTLDTLPIQKAIDHVAGNHGGTVIIPAGTFLSGAVFLKPGVNLHLDRDAVLQGSTNVADYPKMRTRIEGHFENWLPALVNADGVDHLRIDGEGTLDGSGQPFWDAFWTRIAADKNTKNLDVPRPRLAFIENARDVEVKGLHFKDSGFWNLHIYKCDGVTIDGLDVKAGAHSPSTDGTDIDSSRNVTIRHCVYAVNDDCIALKGSKGPLALDDKDSPPVEHIKIIDCHFVAGQGMVTLGSEATIVRDVTVEHCTVNGPGTKMPLVRLKLRPDTPQTYEDVTFRDIRLDGVGSLISIEPWKQYFDLKGYPSPPRVVRNIRLENIKGKFGSFGTIEGNAGDVIENVALDDIDVTLKSRASPRILGVRNLTMHDVKLNGKEYAGP